MQILSDNTPHSLKEIERTHLSREKLTTIMRQLADEEIITIIDGYIRLA